MTWSDSSKLSQLSVRQQQAVTNLYLSVFRPEQGGAGLRDQRQLRLRRRERARPGHRDQQALRRLQADKQLRQVPIHVAAAAECGEARAGGRLLRATRHRGPVTQQPQRPLLHAPGHPQSYAQSLLTYSKYTYYLKLFPTRYQTPEPAPIFAFTFILSDF